MSYVGAEVLKEVVGSVAAETMGHDVRFDVANGANLDGSTVAIDMALNQESLNQAEGRALHRHDEQNRKLGLDVPKASSSLDATQDRRTQTENKYSNLFVKSGLAPTMERTLAPAMGRSGRRDYRSAMSGPISDVASKNPLLRMQERRLHTLRQTMKNIATRKSMTQSLNAEQLPQPVQAKLLENALREGHAVTPLGPIPQAMEKAGMKIDQSSVRLMPGQKNPLMQQASKPRQWAMINPDLVPRGWATH